MQLLGAWLDMFHAGVPALAGDRDDAQAGGQEHGGGHSQCVQNITELCNLNLSLW